MGINDVIGAIGDAVDKINKLTSWTPGGYEAKPLISLTDDGIKTNDPLNLVNSNPSAESVGLNAGLEHTMSGMRWLYSNAISEPIATAALVGKMNRGKNDAFGGDYFSSAAWTKAYRAAQHISPAQALVMNPEEADRAINSPLLYYKPPEAYLPPGFDALPEEQQQQILKQAGMPAVGNAYVEKLRQNSTWFKYGTGAIDFASVMFLDPTTLGLQLAGKTKAAFTVDKMPKGGWSQAQIDTIMGKSKMQNMIDGIWANKDNPQLLNNTALAQHSGMGPRFGAIASKLKSPDEVNLFVRAGMGDMRALDTLEKTNAAAALRIRSDTSRLSMLDVMATRYASLPATKALVDAEIARVTARVTDDVDLVSRYDDIIANQNLLDELHVNRWSLEKAAEKTAAQNEYLAGPARGASRATVLTPGRPAIARPDWGRGPIETGYVKTNLWGAGDYFSGPISLVRSLKNMHPNGYMRLDTIDKDSMNELRGQLARIPGISEGVRARLMNVYLKTTTEAERLEVLEGIGALGARKVAQRYGVSNDIGEELYRKFTAMRAGEIDNMKRYSAGLRTEADVAAGQPLHIDEFTTAGGKVALTPFTVTRLVNGHVFQDLDALGKVLSRHGGRLETLRVGAGSARDAVEAGADYLSYLWKFTTLFRLGYIPRVLGDDLASQWARAGTAAMALRTARGVGNAFGNTALRFMKPALRARETNARNGIMYAQDELKLLAPDIAKTGGALKAEALARTRDVSVARARDAAAQAKAAALDPADLSPKALAVRNFAKQRAAQLRAAEARFAAGASPGKTAYLKTLTDRRDFLARHESTLTAQADEYLRQQQRVTQGNQAIELDGKTFPAAFGGKSGEYHKALVSADDSVGNLFATNKQLMQGNLERSFDHGAKPISAAQDPIKHSEAWAHAINNQIMQDPLQAMMVSGKIKTAEEAAKWMKSDPRGIAYRRRLPKMIDTDDIAQSAKYEVDQYLHMPEIRMKAMEEGGVTPDWLRKATPNMTDRPDVHIGQVGQSQLAHANALDRVIEKWYRIAATIPADRMSRHPLFNQFYEGHLKKIVNQRKLQGRPAGGMTVEEVERIAYASRQLALRDTRNLVFDIAHRSDAAAATRFLSPFFSATSESFQRWGRVIAERPEVVGYAANFYNAPAYLGAMQDMDGNHVDAEGYTYIPTYPLNPETGMPDYSKKPTVTKRLVPKSERYIVTRVPKWVAESPLGKAFNITEAGGKLSLSQNSMNVVTQGDPWFSPGVGPIVQIPVNEFVKDKPHAAKIARDLGILPYGVQSGTLLGENPFGRALTGLTPAAVRNAITAMDTSDQRYQQIKLQILQREIYDFTQDHDGRAPTAAEIGQMQERAASKTRNYWLFQASASFLQPMATTRKDNFQFYRDQYNALRRQDPLTADDQFLQRYGESFFIFAQESSDSSGIPPTMKAVELSQKWAKQLARTPELASLVIGPEGNGPFSTEAYQYQLNNPLTPGGAEMQRTRLTADEALKENQRRLGWAKYTAKMNTLTAKLQKAGFETFADKGAESFAAEKKAYASLYAEPLYPDGSVNPFYNPEWSKDYFTQDRRKYERMIPDLTEIANSDLAKQPGRSDLRMLQQYLGGRKTLVGMLNDRKAAGLPSTMAAQANEDLRNQWIRFVDQLIEADTKFGDLYHRYLSRDMSVDVEEEAEEE